MNWALTPTLMSTDMDETPRRERAVKRKLRVTFPGGKPFCYKNVTLTLMEALRRIGIDKLKTVNLMANKIPFVCQQFPEALKPYMKELVPGWYVNTQSDTSQKFLQLKSIFQQLGIDAKVELGDFEADKAISFQKGKSRGAKLLVQFPDGEFIAEESPVGTYTETLRKIGFDKIQRKGIEYLNKPLVCGYQSLASMVQGPDGHWLFIPPTTKDKRKVLLMLSLMLSLNLKITEI